MSHESLATIFVHFVFAAMLYYSNPEGGFSDDDKKAYVSYALLFVLFCYDALTTSAEGGNPGIVGTINRVAQALVVGASCVFLLTALKFDFDRLSREGNANFVFFMLNTMNMVCLSYVSARMAFPPVLEEQAQDANLMAAGPVVNQAQDENQADGNAGPLLDYYPPGQHQAVQNGP